MNEQFNLDCLRAHNELRSLHKVPPLELSIQLAEEAQTWADVLSKKSRQIKKKTNEIYGENASYSNYIETGEETTLKWYKEISEYKFGQERQNMAAICHFAQIVWNDTTEVGFGRSKSDSGEWVVVGRYKKPGNIVGKFLANVHQKIMGWENYPIIIKSKQGSLKNIPITIMHSKTSAIGNTEFILRKEEKAYNNEDKTKYNDKYRKSSFKQNSIIENNDEKSTSSTASLKHDGARLNKNILRNENDQQSKSIIEDLTENKFVERKDRKLFNKSSTLPGQITHNRNKHEYTKVGDRPVRSSNDRNQKKSENYDHKAGSVMKKNNNPNGESNSITETIDYSSDSTSEKTFEGETGGNSSISSHLKPASQKDHDRFSKTLTAKDDDKDRNNKQHLINRSTNSTIIYNESQILTNAERTTNKIKNKNIINDRNENIRNIPKGSLVKEDQSDTKRDHDLINRKNLSRQDHSLGKSFEDDTEKENNNYSQIDSKCEIIEPEQIKSNFVAIDLEMDSDDPDGPVLDGLEEFQTSILIAHNECRKLHSSYPLELNPDLTHLAQRWADHISKFKTVGYSNQVYKGCEVGENILIQFKGSLQNAVQNMITKWYNEKKLFQFGTEPMNIDKIGHFSQIVWKSTKEIGIGISDISNYSVIVCFYFPSGNTMGEFLGNVSPCEKQ